MQNRRVDVAAMSNRLVQHDPDARRRVPCASCGHWVDFEFTSGAHLAISAELLKLTADNENGLAGQSKVLSMPVSLYNGKRLPVSEVIARCKAAVATNPESIPDWLLLGFCYHHALSRPRHGLG